VLLLLLLLSTGDRNEENTWCRLRSRRQSHLLQGELFDVARRREEDVRRTADEDQRTLRELDKLVVK